MSIKKEKDLVAGRLGGDGSSPASSTAAAKSHYGNSRLGLAPEVPAEAAPAASLNMPHRLPAKAQPAALPRAAARSPEATTWVAPPPVAPPTQPAPMPAVSRQPVSAPAVHSVGTFHEVYPLHDPHLSDGLCRRLWATRSNPRVRVFGGAAACLVAAALLWAVLGGEKPAPARARAASGDAAAAPAAAKPAEVKGRSQERSQRRAALVHREYTVDVDADQGEGDSSQQLAEGNPAEPLSVDEVEVVEVASDKGPGANQSRSATRGPSGQGEAGPKRYTLCPAGFRLSGIMRMPQGKFASINGRYVATGEIVNGARVVEIRDFVVEMELNGERFLVGVSSGPAGSGSDGELVDEPADDEADAEAEEPSEDKPADEPAASDE